MSNETKQGVTAEAPVKKNRRGISNETKSVAQLKFHEKDAASNNLFIGHLEDVEVKWAVASEGTSFAGLKMPYLNFHFASQHTNEAEKRHVYQPIFPVESNIATIPLAPGVRDNNNRAWMVDNVFAWCKHMLQTFYLRGREFTAEEEDALALPFCDYDDDFNYVMVEPQDVLNGYEAVFANVAAMLNGTWNLKDGETPKPCFKDANGRPLPIWMKLLRHKKAGKRGWVDITRNGELGFDTFIGSGVIELFKGTTVPPAILRVDLSKESIIPQETKKEPTLPGQGFGNMPGMGGTVIAGGSMPMGMPTGIGNDNSAFASAGMQDTPF